MKRITAFITVLFLTFLTACFGNNSAWQEALTTPSEQKPIIKTVIDPSEIEGLEIPEEPIDYYDQFDWYKQNSEYFFPGFTLSAYTGLSGRQFRRHPDIKPETSGHLIDQLDFTLKLIVVQCFSYHHKSVNLISLIVFSAITSRMDFFESRARIYVL